MVPCGQGHSTATATVPEAQPGTKAASGTSQAVFCNTNAGGDIDDVLNDGAVGVGTIPAAGAGVMPASIARKGGVKAEDIAIDQTDMTWSGSVHCM